MNLTKKLLVFLGAALLTLGLILYILTRGIMMSGFLKLENDESVESANKTKGMINDEFYSMELTARDWAQWDDTYNFVRNRNPDFESENLKAVSMSAIKMNIVAIIDGRGRFVYRSFMPPGATKYSELPEEKWADILNEAKPALERKETRSGVIFVGDSPYVAAAQPILKTSGAGPPNGVMIMGRLLDTKKAGRFSRKLALPVAAFWWHAKNNPPDVLNARKSLSEKHPVVSFAIDKNMIFTYTALNDLTGKPEMILRSAEKRDIYQTGKLSLGYLLMSSALVGLLFTAMSMSFIWLKVVRPMGALMREIIGISGKARQGVRLPDKWADDLGELAAAINGLLESLENSGEALRRSEQRYRAVVEDQTEIICRFGKDGAPSFTNEACDRFIAWLAGDEAGAGLASAAMMDDPAIIDALQNVIKISRANQSVEFAEEFCPPGRASRWIHFTCRGIFSDGGSLLEYQLVGRDVTKRKSAELAFANAQKFASIAQLAMGMSHEMKNPLAIIKAHVETLEENETIEEAGDDKIMYSLKVIGKQGERISDMLARISAIARDAAPEPLAGSAREHVESILSDLDSSLLRLGVKHSVSAPEGEDITVETDWRRLDIVISNLITNAIESMERGGELRIEIYQSNVENRARIRVIDNGKGISAENLKRVFDPFFTTKPQGMGIGLYLCKHYMEELGGRLEIDSVENGGTTATALIPVKISGAEAMA